MSMGPIPMKFRSTCPIARTLDLVGDRWSLLVIRDLLLGKTYFEELLRSGEGIAPNILTNRLRSLAERGLVRPSRDVADRRRVQYRLTRRGEEFRALARTVAEWGLEHLPGADDKNARRL
jgi:DNA-binding HxlR family transcriptional regulator